MILPKFIRKNDISETAKANKLSILCYFISCLIISVMGIQYFWDNPDVAVSATPIAFFLMLFVPWIIGSAVIKRHDSSQKAGIALYVFFALMYLYIVFSIDSYLLGLVALPMMLTSIAYAGMKFSLHFNFNIVLIGAANILYCIFKDNDAYDIRNRVVVLILLFTSAAFLILCTYMIGLAQYKKTFEINRERDRFQSVVSIGIEKIFEYDITSDTLMLTTSNKGTYGKEYYICNISSVAKSQRYVPFTDWYKFDELMVECRSGLGTVDKEFRLRQEGQKNDDFKWHRIRGRVIFDIEGNPDKVVGTFENIDEAKKMEIRLADEKMRDPLTKLYKRPYINQFIDEYIESNSEDESKQAGMLVIDIDDYDKIIDDMGIAFGEEILKNIAEDVKEMLFTTDLVGRIGSNEFVVFMKDISQIRDIEKKIKDIQNIISDTYIGEGTRHKCTVRHSTLQGARDRIITTSITASRRMSIQCLPMR